MDAAEVLIALARHGALGHSKRTKNETELGRIPQQKEQC